MTEQPTEANTEDVKSISKIWLLPLVAILIGCWMVYYQVSNQGPLITLYFDSAEGIDAGKTKIKSLNVNVGEVKTVALNATGDGVVVTARMSKSAEKLLVEDSQFWIVSPRVSLSGVSGLSTLISGVYIELSQGTSDIEQEEFEALSTPPVTPIGTPGLHITLNSNDQFAYKKGDPITYKGLTVGQFEDIYFNFEERIVYYNAFIKAPYHELITTNTKFWDITGLSVNLKADGLSVNTGSLETLLTNGVTFDIPKGMPAGDKITERTYFDIYESYDVASDQRYKHSLEYVVLVSDTVRGLIVGAPVEYRGINIGQVASINATEEHNRFFTGDYKIPVVIKVQPGRVGLSDNAEGLATMDKQHEHWVKNGLKAAIRTGNLLTGSLFIELQHFEDQNVERIDTYAGYKVIPTAIDQFSHIVGKVEDFIDTLNNLQLDNTVDSANHVLLEISRMTQNLQSVTENVNVLLNDVNGQNLSEELKMTLQNISALTHDFSSGSAGYEQLNDTLKALSDVMHELKPVLSQLKHQPNSLIFNSGSHEEVEPKKYSEGK